MAFRAVRKTPLPYVMVLAVALAVPTRAFFFNGDDDAGISKKRKKLAEESAGSRAWLAGAFSAAESLLAAAAAANDDAAAAARDRLLAAAAMYYGRPQPGIAVRRRVEAVAETVRTRYPDAVFTPVADVLAGELAFHEQLYGRAARYLAAAAVHAEVLPETVAAGVRVRAAYAALQSGSDAAYRLVAGVPVDSAIADYHLYWQGRAAFAADSTVRAILLLEKLLKEYPRSLCADKARWVLAEAYLAYGSYVQARAVCTKLAGLKRLGSERNRARLMLAEVEQRQGNRRAAENLYITVMQYGPETAWGRHARTRLLELYRDTGDSLNGRAIYYNGTVLAGSGDYQAALAAFDRYLEIYPRSPILGTVRLAAAKALFGAGEYGRAERRFTEISEAYRRGAVAESAALYVARCRKERGDGAGAQESYLAFRKRFPHHRLADDALWYVAWNREMDKDYDRALVLYKLLASKYRKRALGVEAVFRTGFCHYKAGQYDKAVSRFRRYGKTRDAARRDKARFWMAMARFASGDADKGRANLRMAFENYPRSYYAVRAAAHLDSAGFHAAVPGTFDPAFDPVPVLRRTAAAVQERYLSPDAVLRAGTALHVNAPYRAGKLLLAYGLFREGRAELRRVERTFKNDAAALLSLYDTYIRYGVYDRAYRTAYRALGRIHKTDIDGFPLAELRLMFIPAYYGDVVAACAVRDGQPDPYLVFGLMHRESAFSPDIASSAGAVGLMQIMPETGAAAAAEQGDTAFVPGRLTVPAVSIRLGVHYLAGLQRRFAGASPQVRLPRMLAAYNAGPDNVDAWLKRTGETAGQERYVEELDFRETRTYVRKVLRSSRLYRNLWDEYCRR